MLILNIIFYVVALFLILSSFVVILAKSPMTSILALVFAFFNAAILFILLHAEFVAMAMIIIYVGAIAVLFIFIIMLLNVKVVERKKLLTKNFIFGAILALLIFIEIAILFSVNFHTIPNLSNMVLNQDNNNSYNLGLELFNNYYVLIVMLGVILTVVVIGIVFICHEDYGTNIYKQKMGNQVQRDPKLSVKAVKVDNEKGIKL